MAILGVQFAQSLVMALMAASLMLLAGSLLVRVLQAWSRSAEQGRGGRVLLEPALARVSERVSPVRPLAGVVAFAPTRAPPVPIGAVRRQRPLQDSPGQRRLAE